MEQPIIIQVSQAILPMINVTFQYSFWTLNLQQAIESVRKKLHY